MDVAVVQVLAAPEPDAVAASHVAAQDAVGARAVVARDVVAEQDAAVEASCAPAVALDVAVAVLDVPAAASDVPVPDPEKLAADA